MNTTELALRRAPSAARRDLRFPWFIVLVNGAVPVALLGWDALHHALGVDAVNYALRTTGLLALLFLILTLAVTPARRLSGIGEVVKLRRTLGLYAFFHACLHFGIFFWFDRGRSVESTVHEIVTRTYLEIGTAALVLMIPLAATSLDGMVTRLGPKRWKLLHRSTYAIALGGVVHYYLLVKADVRQPLAFGAALGLALGYRVVRSLRDRRERRERELFAIADGPGSLRVPAKPRFWSGKLRVAKKIAETPDVTTFRLESEGGAPFPFDYAPGQYLNVKLSIDGKPVRRSYTIASSPTRPGHCEITVKREPQGTVSRHLHDALHEGATLDVSAPAGRFTFDGGAASSVVLVAGGVGITPIMSILRYLTDRRWDGAIHLVVAQKTPSDIVFREELATLVERHPNVRATLTLTRAGDDWTGTRGRIGREHLEPIAEALRSSPIYLCGPDEMMAATRAILLEMGVPDARIHTEAFVSRRAEGESDDAPENGDGGAPPPELGSGLRTVHFERAGRSIAVRADQTILEASEAARVEIPSECRSGICGQCKTRLLAGAVVMEVDDALSRGDRAKRLILACQARAAGDVRIDA